METHTSPLTEEVPQPHDEQGGGRAYREVRPLIKSGDVFLYRGRGFLKPIVGLIPPATKWFTESPYTHAGMAFRTAVLSATVKSGSSKIMLNLRPLEL